MEEHKHIARIHEMKKEKKGKRKEGKKEEGRVRERIRKKEKCLRMATAAGKDVKNCFLIFASSFLLSLSAVGLYRFVSFRPF